MRRIFVLFLGLVPLFLLGLAFATLAVAQSPPGQPPASACTLFPTRSVDPTSVLLGGTTRVSLVVTNTCPSASLPVDLVILADESHSMAKGGGTVPGMPTPPEPTKPPDPPPPPGPLQVTPPPTPPPPDPGETPSGPPGPGESEPPFCRGNQGPPIETIAPPPTIKPPETRVPPGAPLSPQQPPIEPTRPGGPGGPPTPVPIEQLEPGSSRDWVREEKTWVRTFITDPVIQRDLNSGRLRVGFLSFNERPRTKVALTSDGAKVISGANRMRGDNITRINSALPAAERMFEGTGARVNEKRIQVLIILSDFQFCQRDMRQTGEEIFVLTVGFNVRSGDRRKMYELASDDRFVLEYRNVTEATRLYDNEIAPLGSLGLDLLTVRDELSDDMSLVPGSIDPVSATLAGQLIEWQVPRPTFPLTFTYRVEPLTAGRLPVSKDGGLLWLDSLGLAGRAALPAAEIEVIAPTSTPTPTDTPTSTPTRTSPPTVTPVPTDTPVPTSTATTVPTATATGVPKPLFLPVLFDSWPQDCKPEHQTVDVALVVDASTSMLQSTRPGGRAKLDAAVEAAIGLVGSLKAADQTTVIGFNADAEVLSTLTSDKARAVAALRALPSIVQAGTAIDQGIRAGTAELTGPSHVAGHHTAMVILTDGRQTTGEIAAVRAAAREARDRGVKIVTIGLGTDVDGTFLAELAADPRYYHFAPDTDDLTAIYLEIAEEIPCP